MYSSPNVSRMASRAWFVAVTVLFAFGTNEQSRLQEPVCFELLLQQLDGMIDAFGYESTIVIHLKIIPSARQLDARAELSEFLINVSMFGSHAFRSLLVDQIRFTRVSPRNNRDLRAPALHGHLLSVLDIFDLHDDH